MGLQRIGRGPCPERAHTLVKDSAPSVLDICIQFLAMFRPALSHISHGTILSEGQVHLENGIYIEDNIGGYRRP